MVGIIGALGSRVDGMHVVFFLKFFVIFADTSKIRCGAWIDVRET